jgi:hypothetical protein
MFGKKKEHVVPPEQKSAEPPALVYGTVHNFSNGDSYPSEYALDYFHPMSGAQMRSLLLEGGVEAVQNYQKSIAA